MISDLQKKRIIADFHIHSRYARACSKALTLENIAAWSRIKGIDIISCADFTHPRHFQDISEKLEESLPGLFRLKAPYQKESDALIKTLAPSRLHAQQYFILSTEVSCIYSKAGKVRRIHILLFAPNIEIVRRINQKISDMGGNLSSDGRPILGIGAKELAKAIFDISSDCFIVPAHAWTPWFAVFGSKSGFDTLEECFDELTPYIVAIETGLSSDPFMNWKYSQLNHITLISNSDAHSLQKLGREANVFDGDNLSYASLVEAIRAGKEGGDNMRLDYTIEFFPEEGMYHIDGHRLCNFSCDPDQTKKLGGICPVCKKPLTIGVLNRVAELADQDAELVREKKIPYKNIIPLQEILSQCLGVGVQSKKVQEQYFQLINRVASEFEILLDVSSEKFLSCAPKEFFEGIEHMRSGNVSIKAGYDGAYGEIRVCSPPKKKQKKLFSPEA